jgi:hypothetical protein
VHWFCLHPPSPIPPCLGNCFCSNVCQHSSY